MATADGVHDLVTADLDGDGDQDIVTVRSGAAAEAEVVAWRERRLAVRRRLGVDAASATSADSVHSVAPPTSTWTATST